MKFGSVCSGIEAASVAWEPLGWKAAWFAEIEPFPCALLAHHYPDVPNHGDMSLLPALVALGEVEAPDILCGGTPCQAFSVAGLRRSLDDARGNLSLIFTQLANAIDERRTTDGQQPSIVFWENVPGVLNTKDNAFGCFLAGLAGEDEALQPAGPRWTDCGVVFGPARTVAWRVLDAQYFGLAQRRKRVFVVASARDDFDPASVLLEFDGLRRDIAPSREAGQRVANALTDRADRGGTNSEGQRLVAGGGHCVAHPPFCIKGAAIGRKPEAGPQHGEVLVDLAYTQNCVDQHAVAFHPTQDPISSTDGTTHAMGCGSSQGCATVAVAVDTYNNAITGDYTGSLTTTGGPPLSGPTVMQAMQVRRLTPRECERLQGFPDDYTLVPYRNKPAADGPRYKALGNSWAVPVVRWIGQRIDLALFV